MDILSWAVKKLLSLFVDLWDAWTIQLLVLACLVFQLILVIFGSRRRSMPGVMIRLIVWASYLLSAYVTTITLWKLTAIKINNPKRPHYDTKLKALLAPLLLILLGNPDTITANSVEDKHHGIRQVLSFFLNVGLVVWILIRCWDKSLAATLYFPMFVAGIVKYGETVWALKSVYSDTSSIEANKDPEKEEILKSIDHPPNGEYKIFLKAYYRFHCLKPHLVRWLYHPLLIMSPTWKPVALDEDPKKAFLTTDIELGFMFDFLYTKRPVLYTRLGIALRFISYFSLLSTLSGFSGIFRNSFLVDLNVAYTYAVLVGVGIMETYQLLNLPFSDWAIVRMIQYRNKPLVSTLLPYVTSRSVNKKRWSNRMGQFNLLEYSLHGKWSVAVKILAIFGKDKEEGFKIYWDSKSTRTPTFLKDILLRDMERLDQKRGFLPFSRRGKWAIALQEDLEQLPDPKLLMWSIKMPFDKSIIVWHIATDICYRKFYENVEDCWASKLFSDYMMFLLARRPYILNLTTANITFQYACSKLRAFPGLKGYEVVDWEDALEVLFEHRADPIQARNHLENTDSHIENLITMGWDVLEEAQRLAKELSGRRDMWQLISCVWVDMICYSAWNCQVSQHAKLLRRGGDIITHVWLMLAHRTTSSDEFRELAVSST